MPERTKIDTLIETAQQQRLEARFYATKSGREPVREWIKSFDRDDMRDIGFAVSEVQLGWPIGMPLVRKLEEGLWEIRADISNGRIARLLFTVIGDEMYLLHAFVKKSQKTPTQDLDTARKRCREAEEG